LYLLLCDVVLVSFRFFSLTLHHPLPISPRPRRAASPGRPAAPRTPRRRVGPRRSGGLAAVSGLSQRRLYLVGPTAFDHSGSTASTSGGPASRSRDSSRYAR